MTNTENTSAADKPAGKKASASSEPTTVTSTPQTTTVVERRGVSGGPLVGIIGGSLAVGLLLGGGAGAIITHIYESGHRGGEIRIGQVGGMPGPQGSGGQGGPQGGFPGGPQGESPDGPPPYWLDQNEGDVPSTDVPDPTESPSTGS